MGGRSGPTKIRHCIQIWRSLWLGKEEKRNRGASQNERATVRFDSSMNVLIHTTVGTFNDIPFTERLKYLVGSFKVVFP